MSFALLLLAIAAAPSKDEPPSADHRFIAALVRAGYRDLAERYVDTRPRLTPVEQVGLEASLAHQLARAAERLPDADQRAQLVHQALIRIERHAHTTEIPAAVHLELLRARADVLATQARHLPWPSLVESDAVFGKADQALMEAQELATASADANQASNPDDAARDLAAAAGLQYERAALNFDWASRSPANAPARRERLAHAADWAEEFLFASPEPGADVPLAKLLCGMIHAQIWRDSTPHDADELRLALGFLDDARSDPALGVLSLLLDVASPDQPGADHLAAIAEQLACEQARLLNDAGMPGKARAARDLLELVEQKQLQASSWREAAQLEQARAARALGNLDEATRLAAAAWKAASVPATRAAAEQLLSELTADHPAADADVAPELLLTATDALLASGRLDQALTTAQHAVLSTLPGSDALLTARFWAKLGDIYIRRSEPLQASIAYEEALRTSPPGRSDELEPWARGYYNALVMRAEQTGSAFDRARQRSSATDLSRLGLQLGASLAFLLAKERFAEARTLSDADERRRVLADVSDALARVDATSAYFERAWVYRARVAHEQGDPDGALRTLADYTLFTQRNRSTPGAERQREVAIAEARYYHASWLVDAGLRAPRESDDRRSAIRDALTELHNFAEHHAEQRALIAWVELTRLRAHAAQGDLPQCEADYARLLLASPSAELRAHATFQLGSAYLERHRDTAATGGADVRLLHRAAELIFEHCEQADFPDAQNLKRTGDWFFASGDFALATRSYDTLLERFSRTPATADLWDDARLRLAQCVTRMGDLARAKGLWDELLPTHQTSVAALEGAALTEGGFLRVCDGQAQEVAGVGDRAKAVAMWRRIRSQAFGSQDERSPRWWEVQVHYLHALVALGETDARARQQAESELRMLRSIDADLGGEALRPSFAWLERHLR